MARVVVEVWARRARPGWLALVWLGVELRQVLFVDGGEQEDAWWAAQEWVALHGARD